VCIQKCFLSTVRRATYAKDFNPSARLDEAATRQYWSRTSGTSSNKHWPFEPKILTKLLHRSIIFYGQKFRKLSETGVYVTACCRSC